MASKADYLKKYLSAGGSSGTGTDDAAGKKKKEKKKKSSTSSTTSTKAKGALKVIDEDYDWRSGSTSEKIRFDREGSELKILTAQEAFAKQQQADDEDEAPAIDSLVQIERNDGSGWTSIDDNRTSRDMSPPRRRPASPTIKSENTDNSPPRRPPPAARGATTTAADSSPPRARVKVEADSSPPRRGNDDDNSPPRRAARHASPDQSPVRVKKAEPTATADNSPPRRNSAVDSSPPRKRHDSESPARTRRADTPSPSRSTRKRHDSESPSSSRKRRHDSRSGSRERNTRARRADSPDNSPVRSTNNKSSNDSKSSTSSSSSSAAAPPKTGLMRSSDFAAEFEAERKRRDDKLATLGRDASGANAETVIRGKDGKKMSAAELLKIKEKKLQDQEKGMEWGKGLVQNQKKQQLEADYKDAQSAPFARGREDNRLNESQRAASRWGDPMLEQIERRRKKAEAEERERAEAEAKEREEEERETAERRAKRHAQGDFSDDDDDSKKKKEKKKAPERQPRPRPVYQGGPWINRFGIKPGYRWDGVDRSNGWETKLAHTLNARKVASEEGYRWRSADM